MSEKQIRLALLKEVLTRLLLAEQTPQGLIQVVKGMIRKEEK